MNDDVLVFILSGAFLGLVFLLAAYEVSRKKVGDTLTLTVWREEEGSSGNGKTSDIKVVLEAAPEE
jgi:hypothetical protein